MVQIELPYPPSVNHYWRVWRGRMIISRGGRAYHQKVAAAARRAGVQPLSGRLAVRVELYPPDRRRRDIDNTQKSLLDALQRAGAFHDDSQIVWLLIEKAQVFPGGKVIVEIFQRPGSSQ